MISSRTSLPTMDAARRRVASVTLSSSGSSRRSSCVRLAFIRRDFVISLSSSMGMGAIERISFAADWWAGFAVNTDRRMKDIIYMIE